MDNINEMRVTKRDGQLEDIAFDAAGGKVNSGILAVTLDDITFEGAIPQINLNKASLQRNLSLNNH